FENTQLSGAKRAVCPRLCDFFTASSARGRGAGETVPSLTLGAIWSLDGSYGETPLIGDADARDQVRSGTDAGEVYAQEFVGDEVGDGGSGVATLVRCVIGDNIVEPVRLGAFGKDNVVVERLQNTFHCADSAGSRIGTEAPD